VIVCVCEGEREAGQRARVAGRYAVIPNAADLDVFTPATARERGAARRMLGLTDGPLAVCVGRLSRQKGQDLLLRAWPAVTAQVPAARLVLVGDGPDAEALAREHVDGVQFTGHREDIPAWLAAADVVVLPSRWDVMPQTMLQAMARGRSVVSTDVPGAREALGEDAGAVVGLADLAALSAAVATRLVDPSLAAAEGATGSARAAERHDFRRVAEQTAELYEEVLRARS
jgi:glycosyltransferase involved in cell wall biosynthesis